MNLFHGYHNNFRKRMMEKRVKRGVDEFKREKIKEFFRSLGWWIGKVRQKAGATMRDDKGRLVHLFSYADAWDLMERSCWRMRRG